MSTVQYSTKLTEEQVSALKMISEKTHIPQAVLVREAIDMLIEELSKETKSTDFLAFVKGKVKEDKDLLDKLAKA